MSLIKGIISKKEHRKMYRGGKSVSRHCENNGGRRHQWECEWCKENRLHSSRKRKEKWT